MGIQYSMVVPIYGDGYLAHALCAEIERVVSSYVGSAPLQERLDGLLKSRASYHGK